MDWGRELSVDISILAGVPLGFAKGPVLFLVYTNDLPANIAMGGVSLFADDIFIIKSWRRIEKRDFDRNGGSGRMDFQQQLNAK